MLGRVLGVAAGAALVAVAVWALSGGFASYDPRTLSESEAKRVLRELPFRIEFDAVPVPDGASGAFAGTAYGDHHTVVRFGVSLGRGYHPVRLPRPALLEPTGGETFLVSDDLMVRNAKGRLAINPRIRTSAQDRESVSMITAIEGALCRATTGEPCAI